MRKIAFFSLFLGLTWSAIAREGMWLPLLLNKNLPEMQQMGFKLTAEEVYSVKHSSLKDAIVLFGTGCTGEIISNEGLLVTNHHCGFGQIQAHSSLEHDYLTDGFWAMNRDEELPNKGLSVTFLVEMRDVTQQVLAGTDSLITENALQKRREENIANLIAEATKDTNYEAIVKPFFSGNQYFLFVNERFTDVRLVGAPPSAIGKFGGDTDNWMWPRHTGDFSLFRIYADSLNRPAAYSPNNVPYRPKKFFPINISGINEGDFTMVFGYPGTTTQYLHSAAVKQIMEQRDPDRIAIRDRKLKIMAAAMEADRGIRIQYAAKYASTSNSWKKWQGEILGLKRMNALSMKETEEKAFAQWVAADAKRKYEYGTVLTQFEKLYNEIAVYQKAKDYFDETILRGADTYLIYGMLKTLPAEMNASKLKSELYRINNYFKDHNTPVDQQVFTDLMAHYHKGVPDSLCPSAFNKLMGKKNSAGKLAKIYSNSVLHDQALLVELIEQGKLKQLKKKLKNDKLCQFYESFANSYYSLIYPEFTRLSQLIDQNQKLYMAALLEMKQDELIYPDANLTLRISYGNVEGFIPNDGVKYRYYTTLDGIMAKDNPDIYDYNVPAKLKELWKVKDYGLYANDKGELPVCFTASNHTTGGNSGSPVIDANGNLIGINFDRGWEGTMSDILFDPEKCRNISLDMRYMLFLIDKYAGAGYLLKEMDVRN
jgi:hypothetical protein